MVASQRVHGISLMVVGATIASFAAPRMRNHGRAALGGLSDLIDLAAVGYEHQTAAMPTAAEDESPVVAAASAVTAAAAATARKDVEPGA